MLLAARVDAGDKQYPDSRTVAHSLGLAAVPIMVVLMMPDLGSTMVMTVTILGVLLASGASNRWIFGLLAVGVLGAISVWRLHILDQYQINRFAAFADEPRPGGRGLQHQPGPHRHRFGRPDRRRPLPRRADHRPVRAGTAD